MKKTTNTTGLWWWDLPLKKGIFRICLCLMALKKVRSLDRDQTLASPNSSKNHMSQRYKMFRTQMLPFATPLRTTNVCHQYGEVPITASPYRHKSLSAKHYSWCQKLSDGPINNKNKNLILVIPQHLPTLPLSDGQDLGNALISPFTTFKKNAGRISLSPICDFYSGGMSLTTILVHQNLWRSSNNQMEHVGALGRYPQICTTMYLLNIWVIYGIWGRILGTNCQGYPHLPFEKPGTTISQFYKILLRDSSTKYPIWKPKGNKHHH